MPEPFADLLADSFSMLKEQTPSFYRSVCRILTPHEVLVCVGEESVPMLFQLAGVRFLRHATSPSIRIETTRDAIIRLLDAEETLMSSVSKNDLVLKGEVDHLLQFHDGLMAYLHGAVRAPSFPQLSKRLRAV